MKSHRAVLTQTNFCVASALIALLACLVSGFSAAQAAEANWIWSPEHAKEQVPQATCLFRKSFRLTKPLRGQVMITADDQYELFVNGRRIAKGESSKTLQKFTIDDQLRRGQNVVGIRVTNRRGNTGAVVARVMVQEQGKPWTTYSTDSTWKTSLAKIPLWYMPQYNDQKWKTAQSFGRLGDAAPWDLEQGVATSERHKSSRFQIHSDFTVERVLNASQTESLIAMTFNEFGHVIAARENGPLILITDEDEDGQYEKIRTYCDKVTNCQGILALNGNVFVTGQGPDGSGLYRLEDEDEDGVLESVKTLIEFEGKPGEHGAHGLTFGPDGLIYLVLGNHVHPKVEYEPNSPYRDHYEGDLLTPRYEDPGGHAVGIKAPGGVVLRTDVQGTSVQVVAGGLRNAYDLAFNADGELFVHDSDMESDEGTTWYRPTKVFHVTEGSEFGWRSGWAKWNEHFVDTLPATVDTGRGSPTGATFYNHFMFPHRYHGVGFFADWSEGRILAVKFKRQGATYTANSEVFLQGSPLNVTDVEVGHDGWLYFVTGGRASGGSLYRVKWRGDVPDDITQIGGGITGVIRQPQIQSAYARQQIAGLKAELGADWTKQVVGVALSADNPPEYRTRAMDLLQLFGPAPTPKLLVDLSLEPNEQVRAKAAALMGMNPDERTHLRLIDMLKDSDRAVRRKACEALLRTAQPVPHDKLWPLLESDDRHEAWAARRLLERQPTEAWRDDILSADRRVFVVGALALLISQPTEENCLDVLAQVSTRMQQFVSDDDFIDMLRLAQVALHRGKIDPKDVPELRDQFAEEFPSGNMKMNRELARLIAYLQGTSAIGRALDYLQSDAPETEKLHLALHIQFLRSGWTADQKLALLQYFEEAQNRIGGGSYNMYVVNATRDFAKNLSEEEARKVIVAGAEWPNAALGSLYKLPNKLDDELRQSLLKLDAAIANKTESSYDRLKIGIVAVLAQDGAEDALKYLREAWLLYPERRAMIAMGLAQHPNPDNWPYLVQSLPILEGFQAGDVLTQLRKIDLKPDEAEYYRNVILCGLRLGDEGGLLAAKLLTHWTGTPQGEPEAKWPQQLEAWQEWFTTEYPDALPAVLPEQNVNAKWSLKQITEYLNAQETSPNHENGQAVFAKANCAKCHRFGTQGEAMGPDLTSVGRRFSQKEILQSILYPSHVISSQYRARKVLTTDGKVYIGIAAPGAANELVILQSNGQKVVVQEDEIEENLVSKQSAMPGDLLDSLTLQEIADLLEHLGTTPAAAVTNRP